MNAGDDRRCLSAEWQALQARTLRSGRAPLLAPLSAECSAWVQLGTTDAKACRLGRWISLGRAERSEMYPDIRAGEIMVGDSQRLEAPRLGSMMARGP